MKKIFKFAGLAILILVIYFGFTTYPKLDLIAGFSAKSVASGHFIDNRPLEMIEKGDNDIELINLAKNNIDDSNAFASASVYGLKERKAIYRDGLGATLIDNEFDVTKPYETPKRSQSKPFPFPYGDLDQSDTVFSALNYERLNLTVSNAFDKKGVKDKRTRAVIVIYRDKIIAEKYDTGFNKNSKILGWSMTKSLTATYFGILEKQGRFDTNKPAPITQWKNDERATITTKNLLNMNSGLSWEEDYSKISDVTKMLFLEADMTQSQIDKPLTGKPNTSWNYSSGTTNLLSGILRKQFKTHQEYLDFWYSELIDKIGMRSMLVETDMAGNFVGSSYGWATTRDWAKFGLLYLKKGDWNGEQLFNEDWTKFVATPTNTSNGQYGGQFWLNAGGKFPNVPKDMFYASGYQGQMVAIFPSHNLVIVRMGLSENFDFNGFLSEVVGSLGKE